MNSVLPNKVGDTSDDSSTKLKARAMHSATPTLSLSTISRLDSADSYSCDSSKGSSRVSSRGSAVSVLPTTSPVVGSGSGSGAVSSSASVSSPPFRSIQPFTLPLTATLSPITHNVKGGLYRAIHSRDSSVDEDPLNTRVPHTPTLQTYSMLNLCPSPPVTETTEIQLEYDPISRRKVLNTYEILREIGRGEHGKVKLAKDLVHNELVAIKIVSRWRRNKPSLRRKLADPANEYEVKIRREIAIMKTCNHKHIVRLREVLDDVNSNKIYLVLEYLEKGEIRWKRTANTKSQANANQSDDIPCCGAKSRKNTTFGPAINTTMEVTPVDDTNQDNYLLSNEYLPNLTFKQSRKIFRDVILGLEYLHMQGIVHRDIKPANLLVSAQNVVKISDFGVSFALSLNGLVADELELAKTAGTPAFFAPELCGGAGCRKEDKFEDTDPHENSDNYSNRIKTCESADCTMKINYKIDIWALGVTLYCLLFGKVPFNADSEFELFQVIANDPFEFPSSPHDFNSPGDVTNTEFEFAKDLLRKLLDKNATTRIEISEIKKHPFTLMDMEADELYSFNNMNNGDVVLTETEISNSGSLVGVGARIKRSLVKAIRGSISSGSESEARNRFAALSLDHSRSTSSEESSYNSTIRLNSNGGNNSMILSEAFGDYSGIGSRAISRSGSTSDATAQNATSPRASRSSLYSLPHNFIDSANTLRRGSSASAVEAPQIETKRNVGGDLYLKNQTAVEAFKGIQEMDEKRRHAKEREEKRRNLREKEQKLAQSKTLEQSFKTSPYNPSDLRYSFDSKDPSDPKHLPKPLTLKVGPISIEPRRPSCVMALPLSESFASLDSLNDDYLTLKYHEFTTNKAASAAATMAATPVTPNLSISDKFNSFNMDSLMKKTLVTPKAREGIPPFQRFSSDSSLYSDESSSLDDEEAGNLTLAFTSKVGAASRPKVLSLSNRSKSHDSNLPRLINHASEVRQFDVPIMFQEDLPEFEDLPFGLIPDLTRGGSTATGMGPSVSLMSNASNATLTPEKMGPSISQMTVRMGDYGSTPPESSSGSFSTPGRLPQGQRTISPLVMNAPTSDIATANSHLRNQVIRSVAGDSITERSDHFNNHYKKEPVYSPFPNALHLDNDKEAKRDSACEKQVKNRPNYYRSNSVTVGILQNNR